MPHVQNVNGFVDHDEKHSMDSAVARAEQQLADAFVERSALRRECTAFRVLRQSLDALPRPANPLACRPWCTPTNVTIGRTKIVLGFGRYDHTVKHPQPLDFALQF